MKNQLINAIIFILFLNTSNFILSYSQIYFSSNVTGIGKVIFEKVRTDSFYTKEDIVLNGLKIRGTKGYSFEKKWMLYIEESKLAIIKYSTVQAPPLWALDSILIKKVAYNMPNIFVFSALPISDIRYTYIIDVVRYEENKNFTRIKKFELFTIDRFGIRNLETFKVYENLENKILQAYVKFKNKNFEKVYIVDLSTLEVGEYELEFENFINDKSLIISSSDNDVKKLEIVQKIWDNEIRERFKTEDLFLFEDKMYIYCLNLKRKNKVVIYSKEAKSWDVYKIRFIKNVKEAPFWDDWE